MLKIDVALVKVCGGQCNTQAIGFNGPFFSVVFDCSEFRGQLNTQAGPSQAGLGSLISNLEKIVKVFPP
jgi:hypothetical protein